MEMISSLSLEALVEMVRAEPQDGSDFVIALAESDPGKALALVEACGVNAPAVGEPIMSGIVEHLGFEGAAAKLAEMSGMMIEAQASGHLVDLWTEKDPTASLAWIKSLPNADRSFWSLLGWARTAGRAHPEEALALFDELGSPMMRDRIVGRAVTGLAETDLDRAF